MAKHMVLTYLHLLDPEIPIDCSSTMFHIQQVEKKGFGAERTYLVGALAEPSFSRCRG